MSIGLQSQYPFAPVSAATITFTAATVVPTAVQSTAGVDQYLVTNTSSTTVVQLGYGTTAGAAQTNANTAGSFIVLLPNTTQVFQLSKNLYFSGYAASNSAVYITPGYGM